MSFGTRPPASSAGSACDDPVGRLREDGFCVLDASTLAKLAGQPLSAFDAALPFWDDLPPDDYLKDGGRYRNRRHGSFVQRFEGRMVNIHPSLLPMFPGLHTHERAIEAGCKVAGASVHRVTADLDHGPILLQAAVPVLANDDAASLAARVLKAEHVIYPRAVRWLVDDALLFNGASVTHRNGDAQWWMSPDA